MRFALAAMIALFAVSSVHAAAPPVEWKLSKEDRRFLDGLFAFLVDPTGAERVSVPLWTRDPERDSRRGRFRATEVPDDTRVWRFPAGGGKRPRYVAPDGAELRAWGGRKGIDFVAECRAILARKLDMIDSAQLDVGETEVALAAWLYRLGHEQLAAAFLARFKNRDVRAGALRGFLAERVYNEMVLALIAGADEEALAHCKHLLRLYPAEAREIKHAPGIAADIQRRAKRGRKRPNLPPGFERRPVKKRVAYLIEALEDASAEAVKGNWATKALVDIGDDAVPALIDAIEKDRRFTRIRVLGLTGTGDSDSLMPVREVAYYVLHAILRTEHMLKSPARDAEIQRELARRNSDGWELLGDIIEQLHPTWTDPARKHTVVRLRAYWKAYGHLRLQERLLAHLKDASAGREAWRESARALAWGDCVSTEGEFGYLTREDIAKLLKRRGKPGPQGLVVARALLAALQRELDAHAAALAKGEEPDESRECIVADYLACVVAWGDARILPELRRRFKGAKGAERLHLAHTCRLLGDVRPLDNIADDLERGLIPPPVDQDDESRLDFLINSVAVANTPACDRAMSSLANTKHPLYNLAREKVLYSSRGGGWTSHPYSIRILARELDNKAQEGDTERRCDMVAKKLDWMLAGAPKCSGLPKDADSDVDALKSFLKRFDGKIRQAADADQKALKHEKWHTWVYFVPDIRPLSRPATAADVKAGRAVFHLAGKGKLSKRKLPAVAEMKGENGLIVQAEIGADGKEVFGVITRHALRRVEAKEAKRIKPLSDE
jgi:hypothetical protein